MPISNQIEGKKAAVTTTVNHTNTAKAVKSGSVEVFATPMMAALMEQAACLCLVDELDPGTTSVGTAINIMHTAPSAPGEEVTAVAEIEHVFGRKVEFLVYARDSGGEIGSGRHTRVIVDERQFMDKAHGR